MTQRKLTPEDAEKLTLALTQYINTEILVETDELFPNEYDKIHSLVLKFSSN